MKIKEEFMEIIYYNVLVDYQQFKWTDFSLVYPNRLVYHPERDINRYSLSIKYKPKNDPCYGVEDGNYELQLSSPTFGYRRMLLYRGKSPAQILKVLQEAYTGYINAHDEQISFMKNVWQEWWEAKYPAR